MTLKAEKREKTGRQSKQLRDQGKIPAVVYGHGFANESVTLSAVEFTKILEQAGESTLVAMQVGSGEEYKVIIQDVQCDPVSNQIIHADLRRVRMDEKIEADIPLIFVGTPPAVKELGGIMVNPLNAVTVKALPQDLVHEFKVDVSGIKTFDDVLRVKDINIPDNFEILSQLDAAIVLVEEPRVEEVETEKPEDELPEGAEEDQVEGDDGEKKDLKEGDKTEEKAEAASKKE